MSRLHFIVLTLVFCIAYFISFQPTAGAASQTAAIGIVLDGLPLTTDVPPLARNGRVYLPFRVLAEAMNITVSWDPATRTVHACDGGTTLELAVGRPTAVKNGSPVPLDAPPLATAGRTLLPLRFFGEAFGAQVQWDPATGSVRVFSPPRVIPVTGFYALGNSRTSSWEDLFDHPYPQTARGRTDLCGELALGWYSLDAGGNLLTQSTTGWRRPDGWENVLQAAEKYDLRTAMVVHVTDADGGLSRLLGDPGAVDHAVQAIAAEARRYQGINLDFEGLGWREEGEALAATRAGFTAFVTQLAERLEASGLELTLTLHAPNSAYRGYDYRALSELADRIIVMAYDYGPRPEPADRVLEAVQMAAREVPPEKLVLGISVPNETPESILTKVGIAKRCRLGGIALWRLGLLSDEMWQTLGKTIAHRPTTVPPA
ncbi:MAG: stalk domain-containing protein [Bacillota bacterium]|nr:stalk domain-containing protein [Bacillota bacterium]